MSAAPLPSLPRLAGQAGCWLALTVWAMMALADAPMLRFYRTGLWKGLVLWLSQR
jgi:hypothetical protein